MRYSKRIVGAIGLSGFALGCATRAVPPADVARRLAATPIAVLQPKRPAGAMPAAPDTPHSATMSLDDALVAAATAELRAWELPYETATRTDEIIAAVDVAFVDPSTGREIWTIHRPRKPVQLHGVALTGQANVFAAETLMREMFDGIAGTGLIR